jgi:hypothetical protein
MFVNGAVTSGCVPSSAGSGFVAPWRTLAANLFTITAWSLQGSKPNLWSEDPSPP